MLKSARRRCPSATEQCASRTNQARAQQQQRAWLRNSRRGGQVALEVKTFRVETGLLDNERQRIRIHAGDQIDVEVHRIESQAIRSVVSAMRIATDSTGEDEGSGAPIEVYGHRVICINVERSAIGTRCCGTERRGVGVVAVRGDEAAAGEGLSVLRHPARIGDWAIPDSTTGANIERAIGT